jgi:iron complex outermembrane receptor protein
MKKQLTKLFITSLLLVSNLCAEEHATLDEIIVLGKTTPATNNYDPNNLTPSYAFSDGGDFLKSIPGITASRFGGHGLEPFIRGQSQNQLNIITDDSYIFGGCPNRMDPPTAYIDIDTFDSITVTKGYQSVLNGPGASGGAVILKRKAPNLLSSGEVKGKITSGFDANSNTFNAGANLSGGDDKFYIRSHISTKDANNYRDGSGNRIRSSFNEKTTGVTLGSTPNKNQHIYLNYDYHKIEDALFPGAGMDSPLSKVNVFRAGFENSYNLGLIRQIDLSAYASLVDHVMDNYSLRPLGMMLRRVDSTSETFGGKLKTDLALGEQIVKTTLEYRKNNRDANRFQGMSPSNVSSLQSVMWPDITLNEIGFGAETTYDFAETKRIIFGGRYDFVDVNYGRANQIAMSSMTERLSANDLYNQFYGYSASDNEEHNLGTLIRYEQDLSNGLTIYTGLSRSVRTADATERGLANYMVMASNNMSWVGNPNLNPEKHHQFDIGFTKDKKNLSFGANLYVNRVTDYILRDSARGQTGILVNAPMADVYRNVDVLLSGVEVQGSWNISKTLTLNGVATYTYGDNLDDNIALSQIPPLQGNLGIGYKANQFLKLNTNMRYALKQTRVDTNPMTGTGRDVSRTSGYAVLDVNAVLSNYNPLLITVGVSNIFDTTYANHLNRSNISDPIEIQVNEPGRSFYIQANLPF